MAGRLELKEEQIQRYGASEYASASSGAVAECSGGFWGRGKARGVVGGLPLSAE